MRRSLRLDKFKLKGISASDPRFTMRVVIGVLLAANLAAALVAFKPFGGSAEDMRRQQADMGVRLAALQKHIAAGGQLVAKVEKARSEGDHFVTQYILDSRTFASTLREELNRTAQEAGIRVLPQNMAAQPIEGSDTLQMITVTAGYEGSYQNLKKFMELLDKSPRFLIIENMVVTSPQQQQQLQQGNQIVSVNLKLDVFVRDDSGATS